jgi:hypothetical protein
MYELKKIGKAFTSKFFGTGPSSYKKRIYQAAVSQRLRNTAVECKVTEALFVLQISSETRRGTNSFSTLLLGTAKEALILTTG